MMCKKGDLGLYDCREHVMGRKLFLAFMAGLMCGFMLTIGLFFVAIGNS